MSTAFADTFYWLALLNPRDQHHGQVATFSQTFRGEMVTTEWVFLEVADALAGDVKRRSEVAALIRRFPRTLGFHLVTADSALFHRGLDLHARRPDKIWSLTDCISFVVTADEGLTKALTGDHHFEQAGFTAVFAD